MRQILFGIMVALLLAGCKSTPRVQPVAATPVYTQTETVQVNDYRPQPTRPVQQANVSSNRSVYFDFDRYNIKEEYRPVVAEHARFLVNNPDARVLVQGNTDERGTREYNMVLGQRRADAVRDMLVMLGARTNQIESVSLGEESPIATGHNEEAWRQNRRSDILYRYQNLREF